LLALPVFPLPPTPALRPDSSLAPLGRWQGRPAVAGAALDFAQTPSCCKLAALFGNVFCGVFSVIFSHQEIDHVSAGVCCFYAASFAVFVAFLFQSVNVQVAVLVDALGRCGYAAGLKP